MVKELSSHRPNLIHGVTSCTRSPGPNGSQLTAQPSETDSRSQRLAKATAYEDRVRIQQPMERSAYVRLCIAPQHSTHTDESHEMGRIQARRMHVKEAEAQSADESRIDLQTPTGASRLVHSMPSIAPL